ncbi:Uncharacterized protein GBIM_19458 [Gryllus bimaculatus]|nr:Uncharacterized protein GBIM_19458 [Gryllus bimaculatus]
MPGADDPCLVSVNASADPLLPLLPAAAHAGQQHQVLTMVSVRSGDRSPVSLPSLSVEHNYSQLLADLVIRL